MMRFRFAAYLVHVMRKHTKTDSRSSPARFHTAHACGYLKRMAGGDGRDDGAPFSAANEKRETTKPAHSAAALSSSSPGKNGGGRRISWETPLASSSLLESPRTTAGNKTPGSNSAMAGEEGDESGGRGSGYNRGASNSATALGWSDGFASLPEVQMQVLVEVGKLVRAAAGKGKGGNQGK